MDIVVWLFGMTLLAALTVGVWQWRSTRQSQKRHGDDPAGVRQHATDRLKEPGKRGPTG